MSDHFPPNPVLIVDDEVPWLQSLSLVVERGLGITNIETATSGEEALGILERIRVSVVLLDITMPGMSGVELLHIIGERFPGTPVIINTGRNEVELAVSCMKTGAFDYFMKTAEEDRLLAGIRRALTMSNLESQNLSLKRSLLDESLRFPEVFSAMVTRDPRMMNIFRYLEAVATSGEPVLITGESGTGKELIAQTLHKLYSPQGPFKAVNVAGLDDNVFSDTLFGHIRGAFTGADRMRAGLIEEAAGGVLFLDEIGDLLGTSQVKMLRLLQEGEYYPLGSDRPKYSKARIVAATNLDLDKELKTGNFRNDLFYRLKAHRVHLPPLRDRNDDIPLLFDHFLQEAFALRECNPPSYPAQLLTLLSNYPFPANIRELRSMVFHAASQHKNGMLSMKPFEFSTNIVSNEDGGEGITVDGEDMEMVAFGKTLP
ncbi:MAG: two-component system response regulator, partial [Desulfuromonas sp.]